MGIIQEFTGSAGKHRANEAGAAGRNALQAGHDRAAAFLTPGYDATRGSLDRLAAGIAPGGEFARTYQSDFNPSTFDFTGDPGYQFRLNQGLGAVERSAAAGGKGLSGQTLKDLARFGQGFASDEYARAYDRANQFDARNEARFYRDDALQYGRAAGLANTELSLADRLAAMRSQLGQNLANNFTGTAAQVNQQAGAGLGRLMQAIQTGVAASAGVPSGGGFGGGGGGGYIGAGGGPRFSGDLLAGFGGDLSKFGTYG